jgi:hypothetical protein
MTSYIALKKFDVGKQHYEAGDPVDTSSWPFRRDILLEGQRFIKRATPPTRSYIAARDLRLGETSYTKGDRINHSGLPIEKLEQLVERRILMIDDARMAAANPADVKGA